MATTRKFKEFKTLVKRLSPEQRKRIAQQTAALLKNIAQKPKDAVSRAQQLQQTKMNEIPEKARAYMVALGKKGGICGETMLTAWAHYAQAVEGLPCGDSLYAIDNFGRQFFGLPTVLDPALLAQKNNGAIEVDEAPNGTLMVVLVGPIKVWWSEWDSPRHRLYNEWRDAVEVALVEAGYLVYMPFRAIRGSWDPRAQVANNAAIAAYDMVVDLTPQGVPANGTLDEVRYAVWHGVPVLKVPPGDGPDLEHLLRFLKRIAHSAQLRPHRNDVLEAVMHFNAKL